MYGSRRVIKVIGPLLFLCNGCVFLLVSLILWPGVVRALCTVQENIGWNPPFWDLLLVLKIVRVIFAVTGAFLVFFAAIVFFLLKRR